MSPAALAAVPAPPGVRLRPMAPPDLEAVSRLEPELFGAEAWSPAVLAAELDRTTGPGADRAYLVAEVADTACNAAGPDAADTTGGESSGAVREGDLIGGGSGGGAARILGYAGLWYGDGRGDADLLTIATIPAARRRGVAGALLTSLLSTAADAGCRAVLLEVRASNEAAQRLYTAYGFTPIGRRRRYYLAPVEDAVVMRRVLRAPAPGT